MTRHPENNSIYQELNPCQIILGFYLCLRVRIPLFDVISYNFLINITIVWNWLNDAIKKLCWKSVIFHHICIIFGYIFKYRHFKYTQKILISTLCFSTCRFTHCCHNTDPSASCSGEKKSLNLSLSVLDSHFVPSTTSTLPWSTTYFTGGQSFIVPSISYYLGFPNFSGPFVFTKNSSWVSSIIEKPNSSIMVKTYVWSTVGSLLLFS